MQDYAPAKHNRCNGQAFVGREVVYTAVTHDTMGPVALKAVYRQYTDSSFATASAHPPELGILGPLIKAQARLTCSPPQPCSGQEHLCIRTNSSAWCKRMSGQTTCDDHDLEGCEYVSGDAGSTLWRPPLGHDECLAAQI